jgi:hypothetical protein
MPPFKARHDKLTGLSSFAGFWIALTACAPPTQPPPVAPETATWPDPTFAAERQCRGRYAAQDLERYLQRARLAMSLPGTQAVTLDRTRGCITVRVESVGSGRLAELVLRGVAVPRTVVLLQLGV